MNVERSALAVGRSAPHGAVFLSYASQDAEAVERIASALRAAGVEVWFDRSELLGGDAWDAKIRKQIAECALFAPVISAATQARGEGYFRLEWKLAVDRSHLMAHDQPFLLPVVIDDTMDAAARVPPEFRAVQWTRLPGGETPERFCARVKQLLSGALLEPGRPLGSVALAKESRSGERGGGAASPARQQPAGRRIPVAAWMGGAAVVAVAVLALALFRPKPEAAAGPRPSVGEKSAPLTEAQQLVAKARKILDEGDEVNRETYALAEELLKKAEALDVTEASAWALHVRLSSYMHVMGLDRSPARLEAMQSHADRAMRLAPDSSEAQIASAQAQMVIRQDLAGAQRRLQTLAERFPRDARILRELAWLYRYDSKMDEALTVLTRARELAPADQHITSDMVNSLILSGRFPEADAMVARALAAQPVARMLAFDVWLKLYWNGDVQGTAASLQKWPAWFLREDRGAGLAAMACLWRREPEKALEALQKLPRDYVRDYWFTGPRAVLSAWAHEKAGHPEAARADWQIVVQIADRELAATPDDPAALHWKGWALARLGDTAAGERLLRLLEERQVAKGSIEGLPQLAGGFAGLALTLGQTDRAIQLLTRICATPVQETRGVNRAALRNNPHFEPLRGDPRFEALVAAAPGPEEKKEAKSVTTAPAAPAPNDKSLVVLPLENLSPDPENAFFTEGMHAEITSTLSRIPDLKVISRESAAALKTTPGSLGEKARRVGVANIITGSVRREGPRALVVLELRRAHDEALLWSQRYDRQLGAGMLAIQTDIAEQVARALQARERKGAFAGARYMTAHPEAYDLFLKASQIHYTERSRDGRMKAIAGLEQAIGFDPNFSTAARLLAIANAQGYMVEPRSEQRLRHAQDVKRWAETARRLQPDGTCDDALATYFAVVEPDNARSLALAESATKALPNDAAARNALGVALREAGRSAESVSAFGQAITLDPLNGVFRGNLFGELARLRRTRDYADAEKDFVAVAGVDASRSVPLHSRFVLNGSIPDGHGSNSIPVLQVGRRDREALTVIESDLADTDVSRLNRWRRWIQKCDSLRRLHREADGAHAAQEAKMLMEALNTEPAFDLSERDGRLAMTLARLGQAEEAIAAGRRYVAARSPTNQVRSRWEREIEFAQIFAYLNRPRECVELLAKLLRVPSGITMPMLKVDPTWDNVREDPAFKALLADPKNSEPL